jgi:hypothetical protein
LYRGTRGALAEIVEASNQNRLMMFVAGRAIITITPILARTWRDVDGKQPDKLFAVDT